MVGDHVTVTVVGVKGGQVRLAINAPDDVSVDREEVREAKLLALAGNVSPNIFPLK